MTRNLAIVTLCTFVGACSGSSMDSQPKYHEYEPGALFSNGTVLQAPVPGTVARDDLDRDAEKTDKPPVTAALLSRGRERFEIYCTPCHDRTGRGNGIVVQRGMPKPPSYHDARLRSAPDQHFYDVITNGYGAMYSYAARVRPRDRWAIVAYIRALQMSQHATLADVPADQRARLTAEGGQ
jgi:mono/diheme cytochrome c family protein